MKKNSLKKSIESISIQVFPRCSTNHFRVANALLVEIRPHFEIDFDLFYEKFLQSIFWRNKIKKVWKHHIDFSWLTEIEFLLELTFFDWIDALRALLPTANISTELVVETSSDLCPLKQRKQILMKHERKSTNLVPTFEQRCRRSSYKVVGCLCRFSY